MNKTNTTAQKKIAIIGATGMVGRELIRILEERSFKFASIQLFASGRSSGEKIEICGDEVVVQELSSPDQIDADLAFFSAGSKVSLAFIEKLTQKGCICIDKSSGFRMKDGVPLVVPEINGDLLKQKKHQIIASPNCIATPLTHVLGPINKLAPLKQLVVSTYQAVSGAGKNACDELETQVRDLFNLREIETKVLKKQIAFNVLPFIPAGGAVDNQAKTDEEIKVIEETKKILNLPSLLMDATCVRVPVFNGHSISATIATSAPIKIDDVFDALAKSPGIMVIDDHKKGFYPTPIDASGEDVTLVGRIRPNTSAEHGVSLWISSDNLRGGAALNAVKIAENLRWE